MQPLLLKIESNSQQSFQIRKDIRPNFYSSWHYHEELELTLILKSSGTRFVGDSIQQFSAGDLVLVGENVPHVWKNDDSYYQESSNKKAEAIVIHFLKNFAGVGFFDLPEMSKIKTLINEAKRGIFFSGKLKVVLAERIKALIGKSSFDQMIGLLEILNIMANSNDVQKLSTVGFSNSFSSTNGDQINRIYEYIIEHFRSDISLEKVAQMAHMTPTAFCRFFKSRTRKTFTQFLNEIRISFACRLLIAGKEDVSQVCFDCGFNNLSYFNRQFKKIKNETPSSYREKHKPPKL